MRTMSGGFRTAIQAGTADLARTWTITRRDGTVFRFTDHSENITVGANTYYATDSFTLSSISHTIAKGAQSITIQAIFGTNSATHISYADVRGGLFDNAAFSVDYVIWSDTSLGLANFMTGELGVWSINVIRNFATVEANGALDKAIQSTGEVYGPECRADLGDARCGVNLASFSTTATVISVTSNRKFVATFAVNPNNFEYSFGKLTWTSGANNGAKAEVIHQTGSGPSDETVVLAFNAPNDVEIGDTFSIHKGCDKQHSTCFTKFNNMVNYRGEPFVPGPKYISDRPEPL